MPIYGKTFKNVLLQKYNSPMILKLDMEHYVHRLYEVYINNDP